tara:strand:+ start:2859 stop:3644 length:786 start_codon:yes stop_codon:yes gene_type:complete
MIKNTVIITAEKKENTISKTIQSCLEQSNKNIEIIVAYSKFKNEDKIKRENKSKNVIFLKIKKKLRNKVQDQLFKIKQSLTISKGRNIFLLDGDDIFSRNKVEFISKVIGYKKIMILDNYFIIKNNKKFKNRSINLEENYFYKRLINDWPKNVCTSAISIERGLLLKFFKETKMNKYKYLAIDILLAIYCDKKKKLLKLNKFLTSKIELHGSVDKKYIGFTNKLYWQRRLEQHRYNFFIKKKKFYNLDFFASYLLSFLLKN